VVLLRKGGAGLEQKESTFKQIRKNRTWFQREGSGGTSWVGQMQKKRKTKPDKTTPNTKKPHKPPPKQKKKTTQEQTKQNQRNHSHSPPTHPKPPKKKKKTPPANNTTQKPRSHPPHALGVPFYRVSAGGGFGWVGGVCGVGWGQGSNFGSPMFRIRQVLFQVSRHVRVAEAKSTLAEKKGPGAKA